MTQLRATIWAKHNTQWQSNKWKIMTVLTCTNEQIPKKTTDTVIKSNKCNQCNYASSRAGHLRQHLKTHSGEKSNKCDQCDFASSQAGHLRTHLKTHNGEKSNKCNQCDYVSSEAGDLRKHTGPTAASKGNPRPCVSTFSFPDPHVNHLLLGGNGRFLGSWWVLEVRWYVGGGRGGRGTLR